MARTGLEARASAPGVDERRRFEELALPHLEALYRFAVKLTGDPVGAEDLVQDTYLKALNAFSSLRDPDRIKSWLFQILSRLASDRHRSDERRPRTASIEELDRFSLYDLVWDEDPLPYADRLHDEFLASFGDEDVRAALRALPEVYRVPLVLLYAEEMSYRELAEVMDCPLGTVMSRLHRGRKILERELWECAKRRGLVKTWRTQGG
jgi:RNA polymerase sigma-70 factor (ECF subfamily)